MGNGNEFSELGNSHLLLNTWKRQGVPIGESDGGNSGVAKPRHTRACARAQWRRKIVEFRGAGARRRAALPCFSPANIELFIAMNSPDDSLLLSWVHSESLPSDSDKLSTSTLLSILDPTLVC